MSEPALAAIRAALDRVAISGRRLPVWWRDDDAVRDTPALERLFGLSRHFAVPVAVAAIPSLVEASLVLRLRAEPGARVLVHGWRHANHAPAGSKPAEFGPHRPATEMAAELRRGREAIRSAFGDAALDVFVPPWNRISPEAAGLLAEAGYTGLSTFGPRPDEARGTLSHVDRACPVYAFLDADLGQARDPVGGGQGEADAPSPDSALPPHPVGSRRLDLSPSGRGDPRSSVERSARSRMLATNTHIDPIDWRGTRSLAPPERIAARFTHDLAGWLESGSEEPFGLLTHHLVMDEPTWSFCEGVFEIILSHSSVITPELDRLWRIA